LKNYHWLLLITFIGFLLRIIGLGDKPLFIDEALFYFYVQDGGANQEFTTVFIAQILGLNTDYQLRMISVIAGTLTIPAVYFVLKDKSTAIFASAFVALCPLFVFWSRLARPYSFAGLFVVLGWRWAWFYIPAIATTPIALIGVRIWKQSKYVLATAFVTAVILFLIREDSNRNWTIQNAINSSRFFVIPMYAMVLCAFDYLFPCMQHKYK